MGSSMSDELEEAVRWLASLPSQQRVQVLARLAHLLTITGRALFHSEAPDAIRLEQLRQLNEVQHRVLGYLGHALGTDEDQGWIMPVLARMYEAEDPEVRKQCVYAWREAALRSGA
jgi:hypothetical protein